MEFKMLIVDDEKDVTSMLNEVFLNKGFKVLVANSGEEAKDIMDGSLLDLILLDIEMPGISGMEVLKYVKEKYPDTKVIMITGYSEYESDARKAGCDSFLSKPISISALAAEIQELLKEKDYEEIKEHSLGTRMYSAPKGEPLADILIVEPIEDISKIISEFLDNHSRSGGYYKPYVVDSPEKAVTVQETLYVDLVLIDLKSVSDPGKIINELSSAKHPPKDFICYFKKDIPADRAVIEKMNVKMWDGNPFRAEDLKGLAAKIKAAAVEHGLVKK